VHLPDVGSTWRDTVLTTEDPDVARDPQPIRLDNNVPFTVWFARPGAIVLRGLSWRT
jgi:hypothetical protein